MDDEIGSQENNIFFIETNNNLTELHPRLLCAFESAAMHNLDRKVVLKLSTISAVYFMFYYFLDQIIVLTNTDSRLQSLPDYLVKHYKNLVLARADFANLVSDTPLAKIFQESSHTKYFLNNISDIIRVILLWRFGGTYLDSDIISLKPLSEEYQASIFDIP